MGASDQAWVFAAAAAAWFAGCAPAPPLRPAPGAAVLPGEETAAIDRLEGVEVRVDGGAWDGTPRRLDVVLPARVEVRNGGGRPLLFRYENFALEAPDGRRFEAVPPLDLEGTETVTGSPLRPYTPGFTADRFYVAPAYRAWFPGVASWNGPWPWDAGNRGGTRQVELPTRDMIERALPEGVLEEGGFVSGFVYFEALPDDVARVRFRYQLQDASDGAALGVVEIPFLAP